MIKKNNKQIIDLIGKSALLPSRADEISIRRIDIKINKPFPLGLSVHHMVRIHLATAATKI